MPSVSIKHVSNTFMIWPLSSCRSISKLLIDRCPMILVPRPDMTFLFINYTSFSFHLAFVTAPSGQTRRAPSWPDSSRALCQLRLFVSSPPFISLSRPPPLRRSSSPLRTRSWSRPCWGRRSCRRSCRSRWTSGTCRGARPERGGYRGRTEDRQRTQSSEGWGVTAETPAL